MDTFWEVSKGGGWAAFMTDVIFHSRRGRKGFAGKKLMLLPILACK
jgi:hypothetical protein